MTRPTISNSENISSLKYFEIILAITHFFGFTTVCLNAFFLNTYKSGVAWPINSPTNDPHQGSQLHGLLMVIAFIFLQGEALLSYRVYRYNSKILSKLIHGSLHLIAIGLGLTALAVIIINKNINKYNHFSSVHSWIGICLLVVYLIQFTFGFSTFLCPCSPNSYRARMVPVHKSIGASCLILACIQCVVGYSTILGGAPSCYSSLTCRNRLEYVASFAILTTILYVLLVLIIIVPQAWKRQKTADELK